MTEKAIMQGTYRHMEFKPGLKVCRVHIDIPIEKANEFLVKFGTPNAVDPAWVAIALLDKSVATSGLSPAPTLPQKDTEPKDGIKARTPSQEAALWVRKRSVHEWLGFSHVIYEAAVGYADNWLKTELGIASKRELDDSPEYTDRFYAIKKRQEQDWLPK